MCCDYGPTLLEMVIIIARRKIVLQASLIFVSKARAYSCGATYSVPLVTALVKILDQAVTNVTKLFSV
jgi:hypothetical protein